MIRYRVVVRSDHHGERFSARCDVRDLAAILAIAAATVEREYQAGDSLVRMSIGAERIDP